MPKKKLKKPKATVGECVCNHSRNACYWTAGRLDSDRPQIDGEETLRVNDRADAGLVVEIGDVVRHPESWGVYLADIAHVISGAIAVDNGMKQTETEALIRKGFTSRKTLLSTQKLDKATSSDLAVDGGVAEKGRYPICTKCGASWWFDAAPK